MLLERIRDIFQTRIFRIPDYQRGYSWEKRQLQDFWDDLNRIRDDRIHYMGLMTIEKATEDKDIFDKWKDDKWLIEDQGFTPYYIIDGQQRLTTIIIFIQALLNHLKDNEVLAHLSAEQISALYICKQVETSPNLKTYLFGYEQNDPAFRYLKSEIFKDNTEQFDEPMTVYTHNMEFARDFFNEKLANHSLEQLNELYKKVTLKMRFNLYEVQDKIDVFVTFETTNNRGKTLSKLELLKNRLIYLVAILPDDETNAKLFEQDRLKLRKEINETWQVIYEYLGKNKDKVLEADEFLRNHFYMYKGYDSKTAKRYADILLNEIFTVKKVEDKELGIPTIRGYIRSLRKAIKIWFNIKNPEHSEAKLLQPSTKEFLIKLNRLNFNPFYPCVMAVMLSHYVTEESLLRLLRSMERYTFLVFRLSKRSSSTGKNIFLRLAHEVFEDESSIHDLNDKIDSRIEGPFGYDIELMENQIKELYKTDDKKEDDKIGFFAWKGLRYFLFEYEIYLRSDNEQKVSWKEFNRTNTIEHIYPKTPKEECWIADYENYTDEQRKILLHSLGNLLLLSQHKNARQKNYCFEYKKRHTRKTDSNIQEGYFNGSYSEIEVSQFETWTANEILQRTLKMLDFMEKRWKIKLGNDDEKQKLVMLDFLE